MALLKGEWEGGLGFMFEGFSLCNPQVYPYTNPYVYSPAAPSAPVSLKLQRLRILLSLVLNFRVVL